MFGNQTLHLFVSCINQQIDRDISWKPDLKSLEIDAFSIKWNPEYYYIFLPYLLAREHVTLVPHPLEKRDKTHDHNTNSKKFGSTPGFTKSSSTTLKASRTSVHDRLTTEDFNALLGKSTCPKYLSY